MAEHSRIEELRRRLQRDPASIAFAQLAETLRREGHVQEAIETCRAGLAHHADYVSARVTLGRALIEAGELDEAQAELEAVLAAAPENLIAVRGLADIHQRRGQTGEALELYRRALALAPNDAELEETVAHLAAEQRPPDHEPAPEAASEPEPPPVEPGPALQQLLAGPEPPPLELESFFHAPVPEPESAPADLDVPHHEAADPSERPRSEVLTAVPVATQPPPAEDVNAARQAEALERWLDAILAERERPA